MSDERVYYVYILASGTGTLYVGVTSNMEGRMDQHKSANVKGFTQKYKVKKLLYYEEFEDVYQAITREKEIKKWRREKKVALFEQANPGWVDLSKDWFNGKQKITVISRRAPSNAFSVAARREIPFGSESGCSILGWMQYPKGFLLALCARLNDSRGWI